MNWEPFDAHASEMMITTYVKFVRKVVQRKYLDIQTNFSVESSLVRNKENGDYWVSAISKGGRAKKYISELTGLSENINTYISKRFNSFDISTSNTAEGVLLTIPMEKSRTNIDIEFERGTTFTRSGVYTKSIICRNTRGITAKINMLSDGVNIIDYDNNSINVIRNSDTKKLEMNFTVDFKKKSIFDQYMPTQMSGIFSSDTAESELYPTEYTYDRYGVISSGTDNKVRYEEYTDNNGYNNIVSLHQLYYDPFNLINCRPYPNQWVTEQIIEKKNEIIKISTIHHVRNYKELIYAIRTNDRPMFIE
jgi:hypothetical protein